MKDFNQWLQEMTTNVNPGSNQFAQHTKDMVSQMADAIPGYGTAKSMYGAAKSAYGMWKTRQGASAGTVAGAVKDSLPFANLLFAKDGSGDPRWDLPDDITDTLTPAGKDQLVDLVSRVAKNQPNVQPGFAASIVQQKYNQIFKNFFKKINIQSG